MQSRELYQNTYVYTEVFYEGKHVMFVTYNHIQTSVLQLITSVTEVF